MDEPEAPTRAGPPRGTPLWRRFWHRNTRVGLIASIPALAGFAAAQFLGFTFDAELSDLRERAQRIRTSIATLETATRTYETHELLRVSFRIDIKAANGDDDLAFRLDQLYRVSALQLLRRVSAALGEPASGETAPRAAVPGGAWPARLAAYETTVLRDHRADGAAGAAALQETENAIVQAAKHRLTDEQASLNRTMDHIETREATRRRFELALTYLGYLGSVLLFFVQNPADPREERARTAET